MGLIESRINGRNVVRWHLTHKGRSLLDGITAAAPLEEKRDASLSGRQQVEHRAAG
ncbi:MAG: hypothetical protein R3E40_01210 [Rhodocyclaceae bacterium]